MSRTIGILAAAISLAGCAAIPQKPVFLTGQWGGPHIGIMLEGGIGTVEFDCAAGSIDTNLPASGAFTATGTYRAGQGGPVRVGQIFTSQRATYAGSVTGDQMTLSVRLENGTAIGPFSLARGAPGQLTRCL
ncbi:MAG TPA: hypothetical protein VFZ35_02745 [Sphingomicrobium sp.]